ncbi:glucose 1-dehydrogenase [Halapricum hydrolyticum]|uniref:Glucose 1-dehydrogenase n=1 Tax=Halapricum hydrolyticum TaxID=2979991 RepID=A0AAE3I8T5_9EURY|nr:glucose 1-dehydrogenase [Halapricum hydrolyticum]MCU4716923.1 glucose 1-dehydrogenase [Halapricum hydrolyticum]MCU4725472.1 glucose 1-dehydrogenase [Halapricum hydrolyticum]
MRAIVVRRERHEPELIELPRPDPDEGEVLVRMLRVGIDGTDHEVLEDGPGSFPPGDDHLVLGHEAVGVVEDPNGTAYETGDVVVPTVRRRLDDGPNEYFDRGEPDMAPPGKHRECGISGAHGFMAEYVAVSERRLVEIPRRLAERGVFVEPISVSEKAIEHAYASRSPFDWSPQRALVLGNGALGLVTLAMLRQEFDDIYCLGRRDRPDPTIEVIERLGATYIDSRETPVPEIPEEHGGMDFIYEATGYAKHPFESIRALAPNGVVALLGIPDSWTFEIDGGSLHTELVTHNKALIGSVNSNERHFRRAVRTLRALPEWLFDELLTTVAAPTEFEPAFADSDDQIKAIVEFASLSDTSDQ